MVKEAIRSRNDLVAENRNLLIDLDPAIANAFNTSINISSKLKPGQWDLVYAC